VVQAELKEDPVLIGWTSMAAEVYEVPKSAWQYDMRKKKLGREPLYRPATRRTLKLTVSLGEVSQSVETGFSEVIPTPGEKAVAWEKLPKAISAEFATALAEIRKLHEIERSGGNPPPPRSR
jgi:hypothetical protein